MTETKDGGPAEDVKTEGPKFPDANEIQKRIEHM